jgi:hypothetical protein
VIQGAIAPGADGEEVIVVLSFAEAPLGPTSMDVEM